MSRPRRELILSGRQHRLLIHLLSCLIECGDAGEPTRRLLHSVRTAKKLPTPPERSPEPTPDEG